jgi:AcrR family transcriptional regulator
MQQTQQTAEGLRERKKRLTRAAIFAAAERLFSERGFENVTVAEIADAANISVKTLFTYVRAKEELVFSDAPNILDAVVAAVRNRAAGQSPLDVVTATLLAAVEDDTDGSDGSDGADLTGLEGFHRMIGQSPAIRSRLRAMWDETEDAHVAHVAHVDSAAQGAPPATAGQRRNARPCAPGYARRPDAWPEGSRRPAANRSAIAYQPREIMATGPLSR